MIACYRLLFFLLFLVGLPAHVVKMWRRGALFDAWWDRLGLYRNIPPRHARKKRVWLQVVSVGEAYAAMPLLQSLCDHDDCQLFVTTSTSTAKAVLVKQFSDNSSVWIGYFPYDLFWFSQQAWRRIQPDWALLMESELWPEHLYQARCRSVPVWLINARHSMKTVARYKCYPWLATWLYSSLDRVYFTTRDQLDAICSIVPDVKRFSVMGQLKLDVMISRLSVHQRHDYHQSMGFQSITPNTVFLMAASTWPGEEAIVLDVVQALRDRAIDARAVLVPRHAERGADLSKLVSQYDLSYSVRSHGISGAQDCVVHIADTTGEMQQLCQCVDVALVGKSFDPHRGGQTPIELAACGVSMVYGPQMTNFREVCLDLESHGLVRPADTTQRAISQLIWWAEHAEDRLINRQQLLQWYENNRGGLAVLLRALAGVGVSVPHAIG